MPITLINDRQVKNAAALPISIGSSANATLDTILALIDGEMVSVTGTQTLSNKSFLSSFNIDGSSSGVVTVGVQAAAGTYNFNLPTTAGTSGFVLASGGGSTSPMTWISTLTNPMTTLGDIIYGGASGSPQRLPDGTTNQVLIATPSGGTPVTWELITTSNISSSAGITGTQIAATTIQQSNLYKRITSTSAAGAGDVLVTTPYSAGTSSTSGAALSQPGTLVCTGRPVLILAAGSWACSSTNGGVFQVYRDSAGIGSIFIIGSNGGQTFSPTMAVIDVPAAGTHTYQLFGNVDVNGAIVVENSQLIVYEL